MSADIDRVTQTLQWVLNIFPNIVQVGLGLWILYIRIRAAIVAPVVVAIGKLSNSDIFHFYN